MFSVPDSVVVRRPFTLKGVKVPAGTSLNKDQVVAIGRELDALLDNGTLVATPDPFARKNKQPQPTSLPPVIRNAMLAKIGPATKPPTITSAVAGTTVSLSVVDGVGPFTVSLAPSGAKDTKSSRTFAFSDLNAAAYVATVVDSSGRQGTANFVIAPAATETKKSTKKDG